MAIHGLFSIITHYKSQYRHQSTDKKSIRSVFPQSGHRSSHRLDIPQRRFYCYFTEYFRTFNAHKTGARPIKRILVIEDNQDLAALLSIHLRDLNLDVTTESDGTEGLARAEKGGFDLVILDIMLPGTDGIDVLRKLRNSGFTVPVLMLTSRSSETDRVVGLELGADDYVTKPFSIRELMARVKSLLRRMDTLNKNASFSEASVISTGDLALFPDKRQVTLGGLPVDLTAREFELLLHFATHPGRAFSRAQLLDQVWGYAHSGYEHTVNSHINRLRAKIEKNPADPRYILTVWGVGYKFTDAQTS